MSQPQNVSNQGPRESTSPKYAPDPEKFRKVLGVESADEADQRQQRSRLRQTEEDEGEEPTEQVANEELFGKLMSDEKTAKMATGAKRAQTFDVETSKMPSESTASLADAGDAGDEPLLELKSKDKLHQEKKAPLATTSEEKKPPLEALDLSAIEESLESATPGEFEEKKILKEEKAAFVKAKQIAGETQTAAEELQTAQEETIIPGVSSKMEESTKEKKGQAPPTTEQKEGIAQPLPSTPSFQAEATSTTETKMMGSISPLAQFSPQMLELFEKMVGVMTILQYQGVTTTSITLSLPNSELDGAKVEIEHYDTAPHAFNIQIYASPQGRTTLEQNVQVLQTQLRATLPNFDVTIKPPMLISETKEERKRRDTQVKRSKKSP